jgi:flavin reductase (DIM6/NTAB) family NADH-FMN oxidoreductase RutF
MGSELDSIFQLTNHEIYVLTATDGDRRGGQVATWVMPTTLLLDQLRLVASISPFNFTYELIERSQRFVVHMLAEGQEVWVPRFGLETGRDIDKFADIAVSYTDSGIPILPDTCGWAECQVIHHVDTGDRQVCIADVIQQQAFAGRQPLTKNDAFAKLPASVSEALVQKRVIDSDRDRQYIKPHLRSL